MKAGQAILVTAVALSLTACGIGQSRLNPFNWFRSGPEAETLEPFEAGDRIDRRPLIDQVTSLEVERTPGGAIIRVTGLPPVQGWYDAELVNEDRDGEPVDGVLAYSLRGRPPLEPTRVSTEQSREVSAAAYVSSITLEQVREIRVTGARNARSARR